MLNCNYYSGHTLVVKLFFVFMIEFCFLGVKCQQNQVALNVPKSYICGYRDKEKTLIIDGDINETGWEKAKWTDLFTDIQGEIRPKPYLDTKVKMLWDDDYFYIAAEIMESHIWATFDKQDMIIFHENNFEIIEPLFESYFTKLQSNIQEDNPSFKDIKLIRAKLLLKMQTMGIENLINKSKQLTEELYA